MKKQNLTNFWNFKNTLILTLVLVFLKVMKWTSISWIVVFLPLSFFVVGAVFFFIFLLAMTTFFDLDSKEENQR